MTGRVLMFLHVLGDLGVAGVLAALRIFTHRGGLR